jgi:3-oxoacyl-[acyl-carrier protein] reductase
MLKHSRRRVRPMEKKVFGMNASSKIALVTGAASGIGLAIAQRLAADGALVILLDRAASVSDAAAAIADAGGRANGYLLDVSDPDGVQQTVQKIVQNHGLPTILVNNAGLHPPPRLDSYRIEDTSLDDWRLTLDVNLTGAFLMCRAVMPQMRVAGWGRVINIASRAGRTAVAGSIPYAASKAGMLGLTRAVALQCASAGITVNAIAPGRVATPMTDSASEQLAAAALKRIPVGRAGTSQEIAAVVAFLASEDAGFITGAVVDANGGAFMG